MPTLISRAVEHYLTSQRDETRQCVGSHQCPLGASQNLYLLQIEQRQRSTDPAQVDSVEQYLTEGLTGSTNWLRSPMPRIWKKRLREAPEELLTLGTRVMTSSRCAARAVLEHAGRSRWH